MVFTTRVPIQICIAWFAFFPVISIAADIPATVKRVSPAVVVITGGSENAQTSGSGFLIASDGKIATNVHVIRDLIEATVILSTGEKFDHFSVLAYDEEKDIAIVKIAGFSLPTVRLGDSNKVVPGLAVIAIGNPRGLSQSVTSGIVSAVRDHPGSAGLKVIQIDAAINPGNSGGPIINARGEVIGIASAKLKGSENLNFAIPINYLRGLLSDSLTPITLDDFRTRLQKEKKAASPPSESIAETPKPAPTTPALPERWKSLTTGNIYSVKRLSDRLIVEKQIPDEERQFGERNIGDLTKTGESTYSGTARGDSYCVVGGFPPKLCPTKSTYTVEIKAPDRIEVSGSGATWQDCVTCAESAFESFTATWVPASPEDRAPLTVQTRAAAAGRPAAAAKGRRVSSGYS